MAFAPGVFQPAGGIASNGHGTGAQRAHTVGTVAAMGLGQVQRCVDHVNGFLPRQRFTRRQQREGGKTHRRGDAQRLAPFGGVVDGPAAQRAQQALGQRFHLVGRHVAHHHQKFFAAPAHGQVFFAQHGAQALRHFHQHGVAHGMAVGVVDALEVVQVDEQQRTLEVLGRGLLHHFLEVAAIRQPGQRVTLTGHLQLRVAAVQPRIAVPHAAQQHGHHHQQQHTRQQAQPPQALLQFTAEQLGFFQAVVGFQRGQFALAAFGVQAFLQLQHGLLVLALKQVAGKPAVFDKRRPRVGQQAGFFQRLAKFVLDVGHAWQAASTLFQQQRLTHHARAFVMPAQADQRQPGVGQRHRFAGLVVHLARQRQRLACEVQRGGVVAAAQVEVGQVGGGQHFQLFRASDVRQLVGPARRLQHQVVLPKGCEDDGGGVGRDGLGVQVFGLVSKLRGLGVDLLGAFVLACQDQRVGQRRAQLCTPPQQATFVGQLHRLLVQGHRFIHLAQRLPNGRLRGHKTQAHLGRCGRWQGVLGLGQRTVCAPQRLVARPRPGPHQPSRGAGQRQVLAAGQAVQFQGGFFDGVFVRHAQLQPAAQDQSLHTFFAPRRGHHGRQSLQRVFGLAPQPAFDVVHPRAGRPRKPG